MSQEGGTQLAQPGRSLPGANRYPTTKQAPRLTAHVERDDALVLANGLSAQLRVSGSRKHAGAHHELPRLDLQKQY